MVKKNSQPLRLQHTHKQNNTAERDNNNNNTIISNSLTESEKVSNNRVVFIYIYMDGYNPQRTMHIVYMFTDHADSSEIFV